MHSCTNTDGNNLHLQSKFNLKYPLKTYINSNSTSNGEVSKVQL